MDKTPLQRTIEGFELSSIAYGDIINHTDINDWSGLEYPQLDGMGRGEQQKAVNDYTLKRLSIVEGLRDFLLNERMMYMQAIPGSGYRIVKPAEQTEAAVRKGMATIQKGLKHAVKGAEQVNVALLDTREREYNSSVKARLSGLSRMIGRKRDYISLD